MGKPQKIDLPSGMDAFAKDMLAEFLRAISAHRQDDRAAVIAKMFCAFWADPRWASDKDKQDVMQSAIQAFLDASNEVEGEFGTPLFCLTGIAKSGPKLIAERAAGCVSQEMLAQTRLEKALQRRDDAFARAGRR